MIVNELTGEVIEIPDTTEIDKRNNELIASQFTDDVLDMYAQYEMLKQQKEMFEYKVRKVCEEHGIKKVDNEYFSISYVPAHKAKRVDTDLLKKAGIYDQFTKESDVKESIRVKIKND